MTNDQETSNSPTLPKLTLPWWMDGETLSTTDEPQEPAMLGNGMQSFWQRMRSWFVWPLTQKDPLTCSVDMLSLLAWERRITQFRDEPLWLYRKRVAYAFINAKDAGSTQGFINIMSRLGVPVLSIDERQVNRDWDIISIELDDTKVASAALLGTIIQDYGRTCRRYEFVANKASSLYLAVTECNNDYQTLIARAN
ncbi:phage tail protein [Shewanella psychrotolerans]|uniref:phage tail protein n=1 Tax=Shewanella psychrotolerans TaxID=2864206 RepID=UPI001C6566B2|nr:phage tail protein [Shewanella psychrotolerans]QYK02451.1 phage tail protein [Shewanella psychrotolerans]